MIVFNPSRNYQSIRKNAYLTKIRETLNKLQVDLVAEADREEVCALARNVHEEGIFSEIPFSENKFYKYFQNTIDKPDTFLGLKVFLGDTILGFSYAYIGGYFIGEGARVVTVNTINVDQSARSGVLGGKVALRLVRGIEVWARKQSANVILYHVTSGRNVANIDKFFRKVGMTTLGGNYGVRLK